LIEHRMRATIVASAALMALSACSYVESGWSALSGLMPGGRAAAVAAPPPSPPRVVNRPADSGVGPLADSVGEAGWIVDATSRCGTTNPFAKPNESIRWFGPCEAGRLAGRGTLIWYEDGVESERNEGTFRRGELHGEAITSYPDGQVVVGTYADGIRDGDFVIVRADGSHIRARYDRGALLGERPMTTAEVETWRRERTVAAGGTLAQAVMTAPEAAATTQAANERLVAANPLTDQQRATLTAARRPVENVPTVQLARGESAVPAASAPVSAPVVAVPAPSNPAPRALARVDQDLRADRTAHFASTLGVRTASLASPPMSPAPIAPVITQSMSPAPSRVPDLTAPTTLAGQFAGRDGPWVVAGTASTLSRPAVASPRVAEPVRLSAPRVESREVAGQFAGRDGPWVVGGSGRPSVEAPVRVAAPQVVSPVVPAPGSVRSAPRPDPLPTAGGLADADLLYAQGYQQELSSQYFEAEQTYRRIVGEFPDSAVARLAAARLNALRGPRRDPRPAPLDEREGSSGMVVAVNSPRPAVPAAAALGTAANPGMNLQSPLINRMVCTQEGIYQQAARWCGLVTFDEGDFLQIEVRDIRVGGFGQIGISRSPCTGNVFLTWFSRGASVRVPKQCMTLTG